MKKFSTTKLAVAFLVCAFVTCARAQAQDAKGGEVVRERRATTTAEKAEPESKSQPSASGALSEKTAKAAQPSPAADVQPAAKGGADELHAQAASALSASERARLRQALAEQLAESGQKSEAVALLRSLLAEDRFDPPLFYNAGNALARLGESSAAVEAYRKAIAQRHGNYSRAQHNLGVVLTRMGRWDEAEEALTAALRLENNTYAEASYSLGRLHALRGDAGLAIAEWQRTLRIKPDHADAAVALARALAEDGDPAQGLSVLDSFTTRAGKRGADVPREVAVARGEIVAATNVAADGRGQKSFVEAGEAGSSLRGASDARGARSSGDGVAASPSSAAASDRDSLAVLREARTPPKALLRPLVVGPGTYTLLKSAREARADNRGAEAVALYRRAIESNGGYFAPANIELGYALMGARRNEEAAATLLAVVRKEGARYPVTFYHLGRLYERLGRLEEAGEAFARAAELMGDASPQFFVDLSRVRERAGRYAEALAAAEQYVRLMSLSGAPPEWATVRVGDLRKKTGQGATAPAPAKN